MNRSDRRAMARAPRPLDEHEAEVAARDRNGQRPRPFLIIMPDGLDVQAVRLGDGRPGVAVRMRAQGVEVPFPMTIEDARALVEDVEGAIAETEAGPAMTGPRHG